MEFLELFTFHIFDIEGAKLGDSIRAFLSPKYITALARFFSSNFRLYEQI